MDGLVDEVEEREFRRVKEYNRVKRGTIERSVEQSVA